MSQSLRAFSFKAPKTLAMAMVSLVLLSGCAGSEASSDKSSGAASPKSSASATPTPTPTPTPSAVYKPASAEGPAENVPLPKMPEAAKKETKAGLEAFMRYWLDVLYYSYQTGDTQALDQISGPDCLACNQANETITPGNDKGRWLVGGEVNILSSQSNFKKTDEGNYQLIVKFRQIPIQVYSSSGELLEETSKKDFTVQILEAVHENGSWTANTLETLTQK